jgi:hypothetical protein
MQGCLVTTHIAPRAGSGPPPRSNDVVSLPLLIGQCCVTPGFLARIPARSSAAQPFAPRKTPSSPRSQANQPPAPPAIFVWHGCARLRTATRRQPTVRSRVTGTSVRGGDHGGRPKWALHLPTKHNNLAFASRIETNRMYDGRWCGEQRPVWPQNMFADSNTEI